MATMPSQHSYILSQFRARVVPPVNASTGWLASRLPKHKVERAPFRAILELHALDQRLPEFIDQLDSMRPHAAPAGCGVLALIVWRAPPDQYVSLYRYNVVNKQEQRRFEAFARDQPHYQASDLLYGTPYPLLLKTGSAAAQHSTRAIDRLRSAALSLLAHFDFVAPLERFDQLLGLLCRWLALPHCPCYRVSNVAATRAYERKMAVLADKLHDPELLAARQDDRILRNRSALQQLIGEVAWVDQQIYEWAVVSWMHRVAAAGLETTAAQATAC